MGIVVDLTDIEISRLKKEKNIWLASLKKNNQPHLVPLWFLFLNSKIYMCTSSNSMKIQNINYRSKVTISLEDTFKALIIECHANIISQPFPNIVIEGFKSKFNWDISKDNDQDSNNNNVLIELTLNHKIAFNDDK